MKILGSWRQYREAQVALEQAPTHPGPGGELQTAYESLRDEFRRIARAGRTVDLVKYGVTVRQLRHHLERHYLTRGSYQSPYRNQEAADDAVLYTYQDSEGGFHVVRYHWQAGLSAAQLEVYQALRRDGASFDRAAEAAALLAPS